MLGLVASVILGIALVVASGGTIQNAVFVFAGLLQSFLWFVLAAALRGFGELLKYTMSNNDLLKKISEQMKQNDHNPTF